MEYHVGLEMSVKEISVCVVDRDGETGTVLEVVGERKRPDPRLDV